MVATRNFVLHLGEMFLAMVVGMAALDAVFEGILAAVGTSYDGEAKHQIAAFLVALGAVPLLLRRVLPCRTDAPASLWAPAGERHTGGERSAACSARMRMGMR